MDERELLPAEVLLRDHQYYHSNFQMDFIITGREGVTDYGFYKQALRELHSRHAGLAALNLEYRLLELETHELRIKATRPCVAAPRTAEAALENIERAKISANLSYKEQQLLELEARTEDVQREYDYFHRQASLLKKRIGDLTPEKRNKLDTEMWLLRIRRLIAIDMISKGSLSPNTVELIFALPDDARAPIIKALNEPIPKDWLEGRFCAPALTQGKTNGE